MGRGGGGVGGWGWGGGLGLVAGGLGLVGGGASCRDPCLAKGFTRVAVASVSTDRTLALSPPSLRPSQEIKEGKKAEARRFRL